MRVLTVISSFVWSHTIIIKLYRLFYVLRAIINVKLYNCCLLATLLASLAVIFNFSLLVKDADWIYR